MPRGRISDADEADREQVEGALGALGQARVYGHLVRDRVQAAMMCKSTSVLDVVVQDLEQMDRLIKQAQACIKTNERDER